MVCPKSASGYWFLSCASRHLLFPKKSVACSEFPPSPSPSPSPPPLSLSLGIKSILPRQISVLPPAPLGWEEEEEEEEEEEKGGREKGTFYMEKKMKEKVVKREGKKKQELKRKFSARSHLCLPNHRQQERQQLLLPRVVQHRPPCSRTGGR